MLQYAVENLVRKCMNIDPLDKPFEKVIIISDKETKEFAELISKEARSEIICLEDHGIRPFSKVNNEIKEKIEKSDVVIFTARDIPGESIFRDEIEVLATNNGRYAYVPNLTKEFAEEILLFNYGKIDAMSKRLLNTMKKSKKIKINTRESKLYIDVDDSDWIVDSGICHEDGKSTDIPTGKVYSDVFKVNGKIKISILGENFSKKYGIIENMFLEIKDNKVNIIGDKKIENSIREFFNNEEIIVREVSLGTNFFLEKITKNYKIDRTIPGFHMKIGNGKTLDVITLNSSIEMVDPIKLEIFNNNSYSI